jgi:hypothetical protein
VLITRRVGINFLADIVKSFSHTLLIQRFIATCNCGLHESALTAY